MLDALSGAGGAWPLAAIAALGAFHGLNPAMGWLLAVALGMQAQRRAVIWGALAALSAGHGLAIAAALAGGAAAVSVAAGGAVRTAVALVLVGMGVARLFRNRHPRIGSMRMGFAGIAGWSFVMASAHGAGLMVLPLALGARVYATAGAHAGHVSVAADAPALVTAVMAHSAAYLAVTAIVALLVYEKVGLAVLRTAWINLDAIWAAALIITGVVALVLA